MARNDRGIHEVQIRAVQPDPAGEVMVLLQLPDGYIAMKTADARTVAAAIVDCAEKVEAGIEVPR